MTRAEIRFLGTGDAFGSGGRLHSSTLLRMATGDVLVDCGPSVLSALRRDALDPGTIDMIFLTHLHGDHFGGVPFFLMDARYATGRSRPLVVAGPPGVGAAVAQTLDLLFPGADRRPPGFAVTYIEWSDRQRCAAGPVAVTPYRVPHSGVVPCFGLRLEAGGAVVAFSGDTGWTDALIDLSAGADLFVCECSGYADAPPGHLDYLTIERHRHALSCRRMLLTHMGADMLERVEALGLDAASDGMAVTI